MGINPLSVTPRPSYGTWVEFAVEMYAQGLASFEEFCEVVDKHLARFSDDDRRWSPLPSSAFCGGGPLLIRELDGVTVDYSLEERIEGRMH